MKTLITIMIMLSFTCCANSPPSINVKLWAGDSSSASIKRSQDNESIMCHQREFDNYLCLTYEDYTTIIETYLSSCKEWQKSNLTREEVEALLLEAADQ